MFSEPRHSSPSLSQDRRTLNDKQGPESWGRRPDCPLGGPTTCNAHHEESHEEERINVSRQDLTLQASREDRNGRRCPCQIRALQPREARH